jgi:hypothetical protein
MSTTTKSTTPSPHKDPLTTFRDQLLAEQPKIDGAIKSFCSWIVSENDSTIAELLESTFTQTTKEDNDEDVKSIPDEESSPITWTLSNTLPCARILSKAINAYIVPIQYKHNVAPIATPQALMEEISVQVWNDVASGGMRLTKALGRTALRYIWKDLVADQRGLSNNDKTREGRAFIHLFGKLLMDDDGADTNHASSLVWGGPDVLTQRATQRMAAAVRRVEEGQATEG